MWLIIVCVQQDHYVGVKFVAYLCNIYVVKQNVGGWLCNCNGEMHYEVDFALVIKLLCSVVVSYMLWFVVVFYICKYKLTIFFRNGLKKVLYYRLSVLNLPQVIPNCVVNWY